MSREAEQPADATLFLLPLRQGNTKLGQSVWHFSLPAIDTCPGRSKLCEAACYATRGNYLFDNVRRSLAGNDRLRHMPDWVSRVISQITLQRITDVRIHPSGDMDTPQYIADWQTIAKRRPGTSFWLYTRSWAVAELLPALVSLGELPNVTLWFSCDAATAEPPQVAGVRRAYLMKDDADLPGYTVDLLFRANRRKRMVNAAQTLVCPAERMTKRKVAKGEVSHHVTCDRCRLCIDRTDWIDQYNQKLRGKPLPVLTDKEVLPCVS